MGCLPMAQPCHTPEGTAEVCPSTPPVAVEQEGAASPNLARGRPTSQSSTYTHTDGISGISGYAVDGNCDGRWIARSCTHTNLENNPWWSVDLGREYAISLVVVKIRQDCCGDRIQGATIHVGDHTGDFSKSSFTCGTITYLENGSLSTILCNGALGRYITIAIPGQVATLSPAEVEVHGSNSVCRS
ncbi:fucolectin-like [Eublepharis macularius]|uniref:Fucolectin-like n=1 Tax=Eublepharis macularius TaxID=481883 RepID=A0AA97L4F4_EUBMA|nr:fucolectin-like [Eublepharis macularius]